MPADLLQRVADGDASLGGLAPEAYHLAAGEKINPTKERGLFHEAINRAWNRCLGAWASFQSAAARLPENDLGTSITRERWLLPLFQELGYGRLVPAKAIEIEGKSYAISRETAGPGGRSIGGWRPRRAPTTGIPVSAVPVKLPSSQAFPGAVSGRRGVNTLT